MCELFALSSQYPTRVTFSLEEFMRHGGDTEPHSDGWGSSARRCAPWQPFAPNQMLVARHGRVMASVETTPQGETT